MTMSEDVGAEPLTGKDVLMIRDYKAGIDEYGDPVVHRDDVAAAVRYEKTALEHIYQKDRNGCQECETGKDADLCGFHAGMYALLEHFERKHGEAFGPVLNDTNGDGE